MTGIVPLTKVGGHHATAPKPLVANAAEAHSGNAYAMTRECLTVQKSTLGARWGAVLVKGKLANIDTELDLLWANFLLDHPVHES